MKSSLIFGRKGNIFKIRIKEKRNARTLKLTLSALMIEVCVFLLLMLETANFTSVLNCEKQPTKRQLRFSEYNFNMKLKPCESHLYRARFH